MSYHKFSNLREIFNGDLTGKLLKGITSRDYMDRPCNCQSQSKVNGKCMYGPNCRKSIVVYNCECVVCGSNYIGNTQNQLKKRISTHVSETEDLLIEGKASDSFARHFSKCFLKTLPNPKDIQRYTKKVKSSERKLKNYSR